MSHMLPIKGMFTGKKAEIKYSDDLNDNGFNILDGDNDLERNILRDDSLRSLCMKSNSLQG